MRGQHEDLSPYESPTSFSNQGLDPRLFAILNDSIRDLMFVDAASSVARRADGRVEDRPGATAGVVVGYAFGNGLRVEADYTGALFSASTVAITPGLAQGGLGFEAADGSWTWYLAGQDTVPGMSGSPETVLSGRLSTAAQFLLLNGWYDFDTGTAFTPYVGGGAGVARLTTRFDPACGCGNFEDTSFVPAGQVGAGLKVKLADTVSADLGYRYKLAAPHKATFETRYDDGLNYGLDRLQVGGLFGVHTVEAGLTFALN